VRGVSRAVSLPTGAPPLDPAIAQALARTVMALGRKAILPDPRSVKTVRADWWVIELVAGGLGVKIGPGPRKLCGTMEMAGPFANSDLYAKKLHVMGWFGPSGCPWQAAGKKRRGRSLEHHGRR